MFRQPEMIILRNLLLTLIALYFSVSSSLVWAESVTPTRSEGRILSNGQLAINTRFKIDLPEQLRNALQQGVSLDFTLTYQLEKPTVASYRHKIVNWVSSDDTVNYRLSYHPITGRYRISVGTFSTEYNKLDTALRGVGAIANWHVLSENTLSNTNVQDVRASVRLNLSTTKLPKPFQINALTSSDWSLDSGWKRLTIN